MSQLSDLVKTLPGRKARPLCTTCVNPDWTRVIHEFLDQILDGQIPVNSSIRMLHVVLTKYAHELDPPIKPYTGAIATLRNHLRRCEHDKWQEVQTFRAGGSYRPDN